MGTPNITVHERILASSNQNTSLLKTLSDTEYASSAIVQTTTYLRILQDELKSRTQTLSDLKKTLLKEQKEHESYRDSTMKRLAYRMSGKKDKFDSKAEKEEREYLEAVQKHVNASQELGVVKGNIAETERNLEELKSVSNLHNNAQRELDGLYDSIFQGPTPEFPEEDQAEGPVQQLRQEFAAVQARLSVEGQALAILLDAEKFMHRGLSDMSEASTASNWDVWGVGGNMADVAERGALSKAECHVSQVEMLVSQAQRVQPAVRGIGHVEIAAGHVMGDIIFDNVFSDLAMQDRIDESQQQLKKSSGRLNHEVQAAREREAIVRSELEGVKGRLEEARKKLESVRASTFERVAGGLPGYHE
ncbi:hypothetical protein FIBSPDRAFT_827660 [Athelia psychrophila]|uniref:Uncharacterized protein n=1 Tax=Athelia psychrophila TaxID=1759441 RepID=A0A166IHS3_9AGAM|nr:hypothetical protein FIBSPDRAFT_827660 [Fibularhizoctonia sp. CBS 109695]